MNDEAGGDLVPMQDPLMSRIRKGSRITTYMVGNLEIVGEADQQLMPNREKKRKQSKIASFMMVDDVEINADKNLNKNNPLSTSSNQASGGGSNAKSNYFSGLNLSPPRLFGNPNLSGFGSTPIQHNARSLLDIDHAPPCAPILQPTSNAINNKLVSPTQMPISSLPK